VTEEQVLLSTDDDGVRTLTLNRPDRKNAIKLRRLTDVALAQSKGPTRPARSRAISPPQTQLGRTRRSSRSATRRSPLNGP
jgi:hypothetical protein